MSSYHGISEGSLQLPGGLVQVQTVGFESDFLYRAFSSLQSDEFDGQNLRIRLFYNKGMPSSFNPPPIALPHLELRGTLEERFVGSHRPGMIAWLDRQEQIVVGCCDPQLLYPTELGKPLHSLLLVWHRDRGVPIIHASLLTSAGWGALLVGPENSGKSTVALACIERGMKLVGDDYIALAEPFRGMGLYAGTWLEKYHSRVFERFQDSALHHPDEPKSYLLLEPDLQAPQSSIQAIIQPVVGPRDSLEPITPELALLALSPNRLGCLTADQEETVCRLVRSTPCFRLTFNDTQKAFDLVQRGLDLGLGKVHPWSTPPLYP